MNENAETAVAAASDATAAAAGSAVVATSPQRICGSASHLDEIEPGIWIGDAMAANDVDGLRQKGISYVLTLDSCPLPAHILQQPGIANKYIQVSDVAKEDLLIHFDECIVFIEHARSQHHNVLVHCYFGTSRSVTVVIAFLMRTHRITFTPAFDRVKAKRTCAELNSGFVQQLRLFYKMGWKIDPQHQQFKLYRLRQAAEKVRKAKILPQTCMDLVKPDPALTQAKPEPHVYRCRKCRRVVAAKSNIITHMRQNASTADCKSAEKACKTLHTNSLSASDHSSSDIEVNPKALTKGVLATTTTMTAMEEPCRDIVFVEPIAWMDGVLRESQGKLLCPKCQTKLGSFSWTMGCHCPCGAQVSPAFYLVPSRVELSRSVQNVEMSV